MLTIRLQRVGKKNQPKYRVVLIDSKKAPKSSAFLEILGSYDPVEKKINLQTERIEELQKKGASLSKTVYELYKKNRNKAVRD